jgi:hypothetical protein
MLLLGGAAVLPKIALLDDCRRYCGAASSCSEIRGCLRMPVGDIIGAKFQCKLVNWIGVRVLGSVRLAM